MQVDASRKGGDRIYRVEQVRHRKRLEDTLEFLSESYSEFSCIVIR